MHTSGEGMGRHNVEITLNARINNYICFSVFLVLVLNMGEGN